MRRTLIKQEALDMIANQSVNAKEQELVEAGEVIAKALGKDILSLHSFSDSTVLYETLDNSYVHAGYDITNGQITFNNIEELVVDDQSRKEKRKGVLSEMIDSLMKKDDPKAQTLFNDYMEMVNWTEAKKIADEVTGKKDDEEEKPFPFKKKGKKEKKGKFPFGGKKEKKGRNPFFKKKAEEAGKEVDEIYTVATDVLSYVDYTNIGPVLEESVTKEDEKGNITDIRIPVFRVRNEGKVLKMGFNDMKSKCKVMRSRAVNEMAGSAEFAKAMSDLKRQNALSDATSLENVLESIVQTWPVVLYVTQDELAQMIGEALQIARVTNYDDETCTFMAEGILRKAHGAYAEKVSQILHLAGAPKMEETQDAYLFFQGVVGQFYPRIDEQFGLERKAFSDMYETLEKIWNKADRRGDENLKKEAAGYLNELAAVLNDQVKPEITIVEEAANWVADLIETNLKTGTWNVSNSTHKTYNGDHPDMAKKARQGYSPSADGGGNDWGDPAPMVSQDKKGFKGGDAKKSRTSSWGNLDGTKTNPYIPKPFGDYTMKGEKGVDKDTFGQHHGSWQSKDTWPALKNPYVPTEKVKTGGKGYKMKNGPETDLVVDK
jgi:hypothetical protein